MLHSFSFAPFHTVARRPHYPPDMEFFLTPRRYCCTIDIPIHLEATLLNHHHPTDCCSHHLTLHSSIHPQSILQSVFHAFHLRPQLPFYFPFSSLSVFFSTHLGVSLSSTLSFCL